MTDPRISVESILDSSQKIREELAAATAKLDVYIEQLRVVIERVDVDQGTGDP